MKLEVGKYYRTRDGRKVGPIICAHQSLWGCHMYHWSGSKHGYTEDGVCISGFYTSEQPVAEWADQPASPVRTRIVTDIVPGVYGRVEVREHSYDAVFIKVCGVMTAEDLTAAIATLQQIAGAMEQQE